MSPFRDQPLGATYTNQRVVLDGPVDWPEGTRLLVLPGLSPAAAGRIKGHVIVAGFGLAGRCVAELLDGVKIPYTVVERNAVTVATQCALGRQVIEGNVSEAETLMKAGLNTAAALALTIPDEEAVLEATTLARRLRPEIFIIARTLYSSKGMRASQLGADDVVKAEQAVALQFYEKLSRRLRQLAGEKRVSG